MKPYAFLFLLFSFVALAAPCTESHEKNYHDDVKAAAIPEGPVVETLNRTATVTLPLPACPLLEKRDDIDDWNRNNPDNRIAAVSAVENTPNPLLLSTISKAQLLTRMLQYYVCPHPRVLFTVFNARAVYQAFQRGAWYIAHPGELRPRWSGLEHPHSMVRSPPLSFFI